MQIAYVGSPKEVNGGKQLSFNFYIEGYLMRGWRINKATGKLCAPAIPYKTGKYFQLLHVSEDIATLIYEKAREVFRAKYPEYFSLETKAAIQYAVYDNNTIAATLPEQRKRSE